MSIVRVGHEATPLPDLGNRSGSAWCERPGGPAPWWCRGRSNLEAERASEPEGDRMTAASIYGSPPKLLCGGKSARRTRFPWGETGVLGEETDACNQGAWRGMGPSTDARIAEITSGRANPQQGLTATCKDRPHKDDSEAGGGFWSGAWVCNSDDGGVMPSQATCEVVLTRGNTLGGQRGPGHWVANETVTWEDMAGTIRSTSPQADDHGGEGRGQQGNHLAGALPAYRRPSPGQGRGLCGEEVGKPSVRGVYAGQRLSFRTRGQARSLINGVQNPGQNRTREIRPSGIVGRL